VLYPKQIIRIAREKKIILQSHFHVEIFLILNKMPPNWSKSVWGLKKLLSHADPRVGRRVKRKDITQLREEAASCRGYCSVERG